MAIVDDFLKLGPRGRLFTRRSRRSSRLRKGIHQLRRGALPLQFSPFSLSMKTQPPCTLPLRLGMMNAELSLCADTTSFVMRLNIRSRKVRRLGWTRRFPSTLCKVMHSLVGLECALMCVVQRLTLRGILLACKLCWTIQYRTTAPSLRNFVPGEFAREPRREHLRIRQRSSSKCLPLRNLSRGTK